MLKNSFIVLLNFLFIPVLYSANIDSEYTDTILLSKDSIQKIYSEGVRQYSLAKYNEAIDSWKIVLRNAEAIKDITNQIKTATNIGACYHAMGYHKTALGYFLKADKMLALQKEKQENYWINHINIGVCYMSLEQYDRAKEYFNSTADFNEHIIVLKNINLAQWYADKGEKKDFFLKKNKIDIAIKKMPIYQGSWNVIQLNYMITLKDLAPLKVLLEKIEPTYKTQNLNLQLAFNKGYLLVFKKLYEPISDLLLHSKEVADESNYILKDLYYDLLKDYYFQEKNLNLYHHYVKLSIETLKVMYEEKNMLYVEDFKTAQEFEELKIKIVEVNQENQAINSQLKKSQLLFRLSLFLLILGVVVLVLLIMNYKIKKKINKLSHLKAQNELLSKEIEKLELTENLKLTEEELNNSMVKIKKILLLRKQLNDLTTGKHEFSDKEVIRQIKITLISFFDNYRELTSLINKKVNVNFIIDNLRNRFDSLNEREYQIIEFILYQFTTKEIALLMDKSEKGIQYNRTQIRKKINLDPSISLEEYLNSIQ